MHQYYCDFKKIAKNVDDIAISLNMLNYLIGKEDLKTAVEALWKRDENGIVMMGIYEFLMTPSLLEA